MRNNEHKQDQIRLLVEKGRIEQALNMLVDAAKGTIIEKDATLLSTRYHTVRQAMRTNKTDDEAAKVEIQQIAQGILEILPELPPISQTEKSKTPDSPTENPGKTYHQKADKIYNIDHIDKADFS